MGLEVLDQVLAARARTQGLTGHGFTDVPSAVRSLVAVQAQDAPLARWSLSLRTGGPDDATVRAAVDEGAVVRTHVLRPTWHYVAVEDVRWLLDLTGPKVLRSMAGRARHLGLDDPAVLRREVDRLLAVVTGTPLTRRQVAAAVGRDLAGERLGHVIGTAELEGLVCSGPHVDGQHTYALLDQRVPPAVARDREDAGRELVLRFFSSHGPASAAHLARWCTLTLREVQAAVADLGDALVSVDVDGVAHWHAADAPAPDPAASGTFLLPVFDEAYLTYPGSNLPRLPDHPWGASHASFAEAGGGVVVHGRRDVGWWKRTVSGRTTTVTLGLAPSVTDHARAAVEHEASRLAEFTGRDLRLVPG